MATYKGISFLKYEFDKSVVLTDLELVKNDLLTHIFTRRGERVKMYTFGTTLPDLVFEPLTREVLESINEQLTAVFNFDPRVELLGLTVRPLYDQNAVFASANLRYVELNIEDRLDLNIIFQG